MTRSVTVTTLGCRGSIPVCGEQFSRYGGATCCVLIRTENSIAILDAGTGLLELSPYLRGERNLPLFLTHCHADHILGLPICPEALNPEYRFHLYGTPRGGLDISEQITALMSPPLWPIVPQQLPAEIVFHQTEPRIELGELLVESMEGCHPGGVTIYRLTVGGRRIVYMTDCTITDENRNRLLEFCEGSDLLLCDGQYSDEQWPARSDFGHNCWTQAAQFGKDCGAKAVRIIHHDPTHSDYILDNARKQVHAIYSACDIARDREEIIL